MRIDRFDQGQRPQSAAAKGRIQNCNPPYRHTEVGPRTPGNIQKPMASKWTDLLICALSVVAALSATMIVATVAVHASPKGAPQYTPTVLLSSHFNRIINVLELPPTDSDLDLFSSIQVKDHAFDEMYELGDPCSQWGTEEAERIASNIMRAQQEIFAQLGGEGWKNVKDLLSDDAIFDEFLKEEQKLLEQRGYSESARRVILGSIRESYA